MKIVKLTGQIEVLSGLHIGGGDDTMKIGGIDNQVVKNINSDEPYIPGSSLKGKMRSLLEWDLGLVGIGDGNPFSPKLLDNPIFEDSGKRADAEALVTLFGASGEEAERFGITRISVGDCTVNEASKKLKLSEAKYENMIDRQSGTAKHGVGVRQTERVPAGVTFDYDIRLKVLDDDDEEALQQLVKRGLELIENDYLGGNGSRGYGRVRFSNKEKWVE